jgi:aminoglycoside phosphotransferase (APT) family kinase protein
VTHPNLSLFFPPARFGAVREIVPLTAGLSGAGVHSVATETGRFVLRTRRSGASDWEEQIGLERIAADHGIAPAVVHVDEAGSAAVSVWVEGIPFGAAMARPDLRPAALRDLMDRLARLHGIPTEGMAPRDPIGLARSIWDEQARRPGFPSWATPLGERIAAAGEALARDPRRVFSHNDLHPINLIWDGSRVWIVDWERAGLAHPYSDLATFANFLNLADDDALGLLALQERGAIDPGQRSTFVALREFSSVVYGAVFLRLVPDLTGVRFSSSAETPTLADCYGRMRAGTLDVKSPSGQALVAAALLRQVSDRVV